MSDDYSKVINLLAARGPDFVLQRLKQREMMMYALAAARPYVQPHLKPKYSGLMSEILRETMTYTEASAARVIEKIDAALAGTGEHPAIAALRACLLFVEAEFEQRGRENDANYEHKAEPLLRMIEAVLDDQL